MRLLGLKLGFYTGFCFGVSTYDKLIFFLLKNTIHLTIVQLQYLFLLHC